MNRLKTFRWLFPLLLTALACNLMTTPIDQPETGQSPTPTLPPITQPTNSPIAEPTNPSPAEPEAEASGQDQPITQSPNQPLVTPTFFPPVYTDTSRQLETFDAFWGIVNEEYLYPDFNGVDWTGLRPTYRARVEAGLNNPQFWNLLTEMVYLLNDEHSYFVPTDEAEGIRALGRNGVGYSGVGVSLIGRPEQGDALVGWAIPGNGAYEAGIRSGDRILAVDGHPICCQPNGEPFAFLLGPDGSTASVTYQTAVSPPQTVPVTRRPIQINQPLVAERLDGNIGYIQINSFLVRGLYRDFVDLWTELNTPTQLNGVIIDLRRNTGGLINEADLIQYLFVDGATHFAFDPYVEDGRQVRMNFSGENLLGSQSVPLVVLVGEATNSRAEVFAGIIHDTERGQLVGRPTNGNIETLRPFDLPDGSILYLATDSIIPLSEDDWETNGLTINVPIRQTLAEARQSGQDEALETAVRLLGE